MGSGHYDCLRRRVLCIRVKIVSGSHNCVMDSWRSCPKGLESWFDNALCNDGAGEGCSLPTRNATGTETDCTLQ